MIYYIQWVEIMKAVICVIVGVVIVWVVLMWGGLGESVGLKEHFNDQVGQFCYSCSGKTVNQCMNCFNCGFCVDKFGNSGCIGGDHKGPYNHERCVVWHYGDPWSKMARKKNC